MPKLPETTDEDIALLVDKYRDPDRAGMLNYLNLANDIDVIGESMDNEKKVAVNNIRDINDYLPHRVSMWPFNYLLITLFDVTSLNDSNNYVTSSPTDDGNEKSRILSKLLTSIIRPAPLTIHA